MEHTALVVLEEQRADVAARAAGLERVLVELNLCDIFPLSRTWSRTRELYAVDTQLLLLNGILSFCFPSPCPPCPYIALQPRHTQLLAGR